MVAEIVNNKKVFIFRLYKQLCVTVYKYLFVIGYLEVGFYFLPANFKQSLGHTSEHLPHLIHSGEMDIFSGGRSTGQTF